jgi:ribosomal silencing factor RsfS
LGGRNVQLIIPEDDLKQYLGWEGMIIATATSYSHIRVLVESIVRALRERKLSERGVIGAKFGAEGGEDPTMSARKKSKLGRGSKLDDGWMAVDCRNFIVHVQDEITRRSVDLEGLWSPGSKQGKILRQLNCNDDDAVDDYVAENPIPNEYSETLMVHTNFWGDGKYRGGMGNPGGAKRRNERLTSPRNERRKSKNRGRLL